MSCVSCYETIMGVVSNLKDVKDIQIDLNSKTLAIKTDKNFDINTVPEALKKEGYEAIYNGSEIEKN